MSIKTNNPITTEYDLMSISEIERDLGKCNVPTVFLKLSYIGFTLFIIAFVLGAFNMQNLSTKAKELMTGHEKETYPVGGSSLVTFNVSTFLGMKKITSDRKKDYYLVFGNYDKGFYLFDLNKSKMIYNYIGKPGEGIIVDADKDSNILIQPRY